MLHRRTGYALAVTLGMGLLLWGTLKAFKRVDRWIGGHVQRALARLGDRAHPLVHGGQIWSLIGSVPDWAEPTYKTMRFLFIIGALVIAYPYIPGSDSLAFKGVSVFLGVLPAPGSSSFIANVIAGIMMTCRGAFKVGDRVQTGDTVGTVEEIRLMITRVRTARNEVVVIPNSHILETSIVN